MAGIDFIVTGGTPDVTLPIAPSKDRILSNGSLVLYDPVHSAAPMDAGLVGGQSVPNIAWSQAAAILGAGDATTLAGAFTLGTGNTAGTVKTERSGKGGIHVIMAQTGQTGNQQGAYLTLATAIRDYLAAHPNNKYYISRWIKKTRAALSGGPAEGGLYTNGLSASGNSLFLILPSALTGNFSASEISPSINAAGDIFLAAATSDWQGTDPGTLSAFGHPVAWGQSIGSYQSATYNNKSASYVFQRFYMEDLTVSGRTYQQVHDIDKAFWQVDMASGGRYYGDTYTDPATMP